MRGAWTCAWFRYAGAVALAAALLVGSPRSASAWGFFGHVAIGDEAAAQLGLQGDAHAYFMLGSLMGDLDKSDHLQGAIGGQDLWGQILRWLARFPRGYRFPPLVDQHSPAWCAELLERAHDTGDPRVLAWAFGVMAHGMSDRFTDNYPDAHYRVSSGPAEVACDVKLFATRRGGRHRSQLGAIESDDQIVYSPRRQTSFWWWFLNVPGALKRDKDRDAEVRAADPFAQLIFDTHRALHGATGPRNVSDVCRQQLAMDAFTWNYRLKAPFMPGWRAFADQRGDAWFQEVERKVESELIPLIVQTVRAWEDHLARRAAGQPSARPAIP